MSEKVVLSPVMQEISDRIGEHIKDAREGSIAHKYAVAVDLFEAKDKQGSYEDDWPNLLHIHGMEQRSADRYMAVADRIKFDELEDLEAIRADISELKGLDWSHLEVLARLARKGDRNKAVKWWQKQPADGLSVPRLNKFVTEILKVDTPKAVRELNARMAAAKITKQSQAISAVLQEIESLSLNFADLDLTEKYKAMKDLCFDTLRDVVERGTELLSEYSALAPRTKKSDNVVAAAKAAKAHAESKQTASPEQAETTLAQRRVPLSKAVKKSNAATEVVEETPAGEAVGSSKTKAAKPKEKPAKAPVKAPAVKANRPPTKPTLVSPAVGGVATSSGRRRPYLTDTSLQ